MKESIVIVSAIIVLSGFIALELGITTAILELIAGIVAYNFFGFESTGMVNVLADIGILTLMYVAGLEIDLDMLRQKFRPSLTIGISSFLFPFLAIFFLCSHLLNFTDDQSRLAAIALSTTSIAIVYPILRESSFSDSDTKLILSAAMVTDALTMSALGIFFTEFSLLLVLLIIGLLIFTFLFPFFGRRIFKYYRGNIAEFEFRLILLLLLSVAIVSESVGIEAAIIAFLIGMITSEVVVEHKNLEVKLRGIVFGFFAPIFFFKVGLGISVIDLINNIPLLLIFLVVCFSSNYISTYFASKIYFPKSSKSSGYIAALFGSNLNFGIIAAILGYKSGIFDSGLYSAIVGAVVLSTIISAVMCRRRP